MNKTLIGILVAVVGVSAVGLLVFVLYVNSLQTPATPDQGGSSNNNLPANNPTTVPVTNGNNGGSSTTQNSDTLSLKTSDGGTIQVHNIKKDPALKEDTVNRGYYYFNMQTASTSSANPPYVIEYIDSTQYFNIALMQEPIGQARQQAEVYLAAHLGVPQEELCRLNYMVTVPYSVNQYFSSIDLRFSTCPDATPL